MQTVENECRVSWLITETRQWAFMPHKEARSDTRTEAQASDRDDLSSVGRKLASGRLSSAMKETVTAPEMSNFSEDASLCRHLLFSGHRVLAEHVPQAGMALLNSGSSLPGCCSLGSLCRCHYV